MTLAEKIAELGLLVAAGSLTREAAVQQLTEFASLTELGAGDELDRWRTAHTSDPRNRWHERAGER